VKQALHRKSITPEQAIEIIENNGYQINKKQNIIQNYQQAFPVTVEPFNCSI
jgi:hypothetical protein